MLTNFQEQNWSRRSEATRHTWSNIVTSKAASRQHPILDLQRTIGNQAALRRFGTQAKESGFELACPAGRRFGRDLSGTHENSSTVGVLQAKLAISEPGDEHEQE